MGTYVVTGCAGFIGWRVSELLLIAGHRVIGIDNLNDAYDPRLKLWRLRQLEQHAAFTFYRYDITDRECLEPLIAASTPEAILNLAARAGVRQSVENPWLYYETNLTGTLNLLELCRRYGIAKFVQASTSSVYGAATPPFREQDAAAQPLSPYAASKRAAELLCYTYHHLHGIDVTVLRYFTVYGPAGRPDMSLYIFMERLLHAEEIEIFGDGWQERDFTYVDDIAEGTIRALRPLGYAIINLGNSQRVRLRDALALLEEALGRRARIRYREAHPADVRSTQADISLAQALLGWTPKVSLPEGIQHMVRWYEQYCRELPILSLSALQ